MTAAAKPGAAPAAPGEDGPPNRHSLEAASTLRLLRAGDGRPRTIPDPETFERLVSEFFAHCEAHGEPPLLSSLCLFLGLWDKKALYDYSLREGFAEPVKRARASIERGYELRLAEAESGGQAAGAIFGLKNMGWSDRVDVSGVIAHLDIGRLGDEQVERLARGEHVLAVLNGAPKRARIGTGEPPAGEPVELVTAQDAPGTPPSTEITQVVEGSTDSK